MASLAGFQFAQSPYQDIVTLDGYVLADASGAVINQASGATALTDGYVDIAGEPFVLPREIASITNSGTGQYTVLLKQPWWKCLSAIAITQGHAIKTGNWQVTTVNPQGATESGEAGQTIIFQFCSSGSAAAFVSSGFNFHIVLKNSKG